MIAALQFLRRVYEEVFGFQFQLYLSTRPDDYMGELSDWNHAEEQLKEALEHLKAETGQDYKINPGDGAFYGPKIDIVVTDALRRAHQCATIQLDFQLPQRFDLSYTDANSEKQRPVMIHRAVLGSVERMIAILTENYGGKWPFWLSPRQVMVVPVHPALDEYAQKVRNEIYEAGYECDVDDDHSDTFNKKVRLAQLAQYNFILVVGEKEKTNGTVNVRTRDNKVHGELGMPELLERFRKLKDGYVKNSEEF
jgi:threonyl-tRNA synthetase